MGYTPHVLVVGGGATGVATARDLAIRGLDVTLVEQGRLTTGATGRMQGLLYSGAGLARESPGLATRCLAENRILRSIAGHCIVDTGGLLVRHEDDAPEPFEELLDACHEHGIPAEAVSGEEAREREPALGPAVDRAMQVPDATVDPFRLTVATARDAMDHGAEIYTRVRVTDVVVEDGAVTGAVVQTDPPAGTAADGIALPEGEDGGEKPTGTAPGEAGKDVPGQARTGVPGRTPPTEATEGEAPGTADDDAGGKAETTEGSPADGPQSDQGTASDDDGGTARPPKREIQADFVVNATGGWVGEIASMAGVELPVNHTKGATAVADTEQVGTVVRRRLDGTGGTTAVPMAGNCMLGTTDEAAAGPEADSGDPSAAGRLQGAVGTVLPAVAKSQILRTYWGVRSTVGDDGAPGAVIDHESRDGTWGLVTVVSANLTTHRLAAKRVADHICSAFGIRRECRTADLALPGDDEVTDAMDWFGVESPMTGYPTAGGSADGEVSPVVCKCMGVTRAEIEAALDDETGTETDLGDVRIRTWAAMGECQGGLCAHRMASQLYPDQETSGVTSALTALHEERWRGQRHGLSGEALTRAMRNYRLHVETMNRDRPPADVDLEGFDDGPEWEANDRDRWGGGVPQ